MDPSIPKLLTVGLLAARLSVSKRRVQHLLRTRPHIQPAAVAGHTRVFSHLTLAQLRYEINLQDARRGSAQTERGTAPCKKTAIAAARRSRNRVSSSVSVFANSQSSVLHDS